MKRQTRQITKAVKVLTDPQPSFASLVSNGANQTPFLKLASADAPDTSVEAVAISELSSTEEPDMTTKTDTKARERNARGADTSTAKADESTPVHSAPTAELHMIEFPSAKFADEDAVRKYLTDHGYGDDVAIKTVDGGFVAEGHGMDEFVDGTVNTIKHGGVTMHVGTLTPEATAEDTAKTEATATAPTVEDTAAAEEEVAGKALDVADPNAEPVKDGAEPAAETAEEALTPAQVLTDLSKKTDAELQALIDAAPDTTKKGDTVLEVVSDWYGLPPGYWDLQEALSHVIWQSIHENDMTSIQTAATEFGALVVRLTQLLLKGNAVTKAEDAANPFLTETTNAFEALTAKEAADTPEAPETSETAAVATTQDTTAAKTVTETVDTAKTVDTEETPAVETPAADTAPDMETVMRSTLAELLTPVVQQVSELSEKVDGIEQSAKSDEERVSALETTQQTRKGTDETPAPQADPVAEKSFKYADNVPSDPLARAALGLYT